MDSETLEDIGWDMAPALLKSCMDQVWELSRSARYCRLVQHALDLADEQGQVAIVSELRTKVIEATMDPHANHVVQRAIEVMRPGALQFVLQELMVHKKGVADLAKHRYGCRVIERLIEHFPSPQLAQLMNELLEDVKALIGHPFGSFVMQHLLEHGEDIYRRSLMDVLCLSTEDLRWVATHQHASGVLDKALSYGPQDEQLRLAWKVLAADGLLPEMALQRSGSAATVRLFRVVGRVPELTQKAKFELARRAEDILASKHGRALLAQCCPQLLDGPAPVVVSPCRAHRADSNSGRRLSGGYHYGGGRSVGDSRSAAYSGSAASAAA